MLFELLKVVKNVEITDEKTKEKKNIEVCDFYLYNAENGTRIRIMADTRRYNDGRKYTNSGVLKVLAKTVEE